MSHPQSTERFRSVLLLVGRIVWLWMLLLIGFNTATWVVEGSIVCFFATLFGAVIALHHYPWLWAGAQR